jgi:two-component system OmpR family response regulator
MPHVLIVDDDHPTVTFLTEFLGKHSCEVTAARSGAEMFARLKWQSIDLVILEVVLHRESGFTICQTLRSKSDVPVIMLTGLSEHTDRIVGLEIGADDYMIKPFNPRELLARMKAILRRPGRLGTSESARDGRPVLCFGKWRLDVVRRDLRSESEEIVLLSCSEFELLLAFAEHPNRVLTREALLGLAYGPAHKVVARSVDVQISRLRRKLDRDPSTHPLIRTVRNIGYVFEAAVSRQ